jgi:DnaJ-class molecular chaperone
MKKTEKIKMKPTCGKKCKPTHEITYFPVEVCSNCCGEGIIEKDYGSHGLVTRDVCKECKGTGEKTK